MRRKRAHPVIVSQNRVDLVLDDGVAEIQLVYRRIMIARRAASAPTGGNWWQAIDEGPHL